MYSWGDDTKVWKKPANYDYGSARAGYLEDLGKKSLDKNEGEDRSYLSTKSVKKGPKLNLVDPKGRTITTASENPVVVLVDGTASMQKWPAEIFDRLPLLYQTLTKYRADVELSFSVVGDAVSDQWPVQVSNFGKELVLDDYLKALHAEGGGGPGYRESYELWGHYISKNILTPKADNPFLFIMGDEGFYKNINGKQVQNYLGGDLIQDRDSVEMWRELGDRFNVYLLKKSHPQDDRILPQWQEAIGAQKIIPIDDPTRVVDVAMGLVAKSWGNFGDFKKNISARQDEPVVEKVLESIRAAPGGVAGYLPEAKSVGKSKKLV